MNASNDDKRKRDNRDRQGRHRVLPGVVMLAFFGAVGCTSTEEQASSAAPVEEVETRIAELEDELAKTQAAAEQLREEKARLEEQLPQRHQVTEGETHWEISFDFLTEEKGVAPEQAKRTLADAFLLDPLVEGQETWNFYDGQIFGSFVTQDEAPISPGDSLRAKQESITSMRDQIVSLRQQFAINETELTAQINELRFELNAKDTEAASLRAHIDSLQEYQDSLATRLQDTQQHLSSVYYLTGSKDRLDEEGKIRRTFLNIGGPRLGDLQSEDFQDRLDLRESQEIRLRADTYQLPRIDDVTVLPRTWTEGRDYKVQIAEDGDSATLRLLNPEAFRMKTLVLVVDS